MPADGDGRLCGAQAEKSDGWDTEPFTLVIDEKTGRLIGRGSTDDKGPILGWLNVLEAHKALGIPLPVNLRFCFEGMEENGSEGLDDLIKSEVAKSKEGWFDGVDCVCIVSLSCPVELIRGSHAGWICIVGQLLAQLAHALHHLRSPRTRVLQAHCIWTLA